MNIAGIVRFIARYGHLIVPAVRAVIGLFRRPKCDCKKERPNGVD